MNRHDVPFARIEETLRAGELALARRLLLPRSAAPARADLARLARLLRRAGLVEVAVRLLRGHVRGGARRLADATPEERLEYAGCLARIGAREEALRLLDEEPVRRLPLADLYRVLALTSGWHYRECIPLLERFLARPEPSPYERLVARVNLAAALVFIDDDLRATALLRELAYDTLLRRLPLLRCHVFELAAEHCVLRRRWREVEDCLSRARLASLGDDSMAAFLFEKWRRISDYRRGRLATLDELREAARRRGQWETLRECDRFTAMQTGDAAVAARVYYGTPHAGYRERLRRDFLGAVPLPPECALRIGDGDGPVAAVDLATGSVTVDGVPRARVTVGQARHRFLLALLSDTYAPIRTSEMFRRLHPADRYHPPYSAQRVHEAARVFRRWLDDSGLPLRIAHPPGGYRAIATGPLVIRYHDDSPFLRRFRGDALGRLRDRWNGESFSTREAAAVLALPVRSLARLLAQAIADGILQRLGTGRNIRYRFAEGALDSSMDSVG